MRTRRVLAAVVALAGIVVLVVTVTHSSDQGADPSLSPQASAGRAPGPPPGIGVPAPEVAGQAVRGGEQRLSGLRGQVVVLGFVSTGVPAGGQAPQPSRSQLVILRSMFAQYRSCATTMVVDADQTGDDHHDALVNFTYDNDVPFPLLSGRDAVTAIAGYGVRAVPTVILVDRDGRVAFRWDRFVPPAELAGALKQLCDAA